MNSLQESIQQKQKECYSSFESLDNLSDEDDDSGIRMTDPTSKWRTSDALFGTKYKQDEDDANSVDDRAVLLPHRKPKSRSLQGSRENLTEHDPDFRTVRRLLPKVHPLQYRVDQNELTNKLNSSLRNDFDDHKNIISKHDTTDLQHEALSGIDISGSADIGLLGARFACKDNAINDNWTMKAADVDQSERSASEVSFLMDHSNSSGQISRNDLNNNQGTNLSPHFVKNSRHISSGIEANSRRRSRWDCTSPVTIKLQDSKPKTAANDKLLGDGGAKRQLPAYGRSKSEDCLKRDAKGPFKSQQKNTNPSPAVVLNPKFRQGFNLNAQRKLVSQNESTATHECIKPSKTSHTPKSKWEQNQVGPSILFESSTDIIPNSDENNEKYGGTMLYISAKDDDNDEAHEVTATDEVEVSVAPDETSPSKSYEAFFVSCTEEDSAEKNAAEMSEEDRAIKFPQWVIPFIDDNLTGKFECGKGRQLAKKSKASPQSDRKPLTPVSIPRRSKSPSAIKLQKDSSPIPPPRMKRTAAMNRILQEKDDLACRERPIPEKSERSKTPTIKVPERVKSPVRMPKKLPRLPSESSSLSTDGSESESFPVHYVQHAKGPSVPLTKGVTLRTAGAPKQYCLKKSPSERSLGQRSSSSPRSELSKAGLSLTKPTTPRSMLNSKRSKSMDNLTLLSTASKSSESRNKKAFSTRNTLTRRSLSIDDSYAPDKKSDSASNKNGRKTPEPKENRAMRALREAMTSRSAPSSPAHHVVPRQSRTPTRKEALTPTSSMESSNGSRSLPIQTRSRKPAIPDKPVTTSARSRSRTRFERQDSTDSEESSAAQSVQRRVRLHTPVRRSVSLKEGSCVRIGDNDFASSETLTLPRRRSRVDDASLHSGGYGTLRKVSSSSDMPKKSILKKRPELAVAKPGPDIITMEPSRKEIMTRSGKRILPPPPEDIDVDFEGKLSIQSWMSTSVDNLNLNRSSSRDDIFKSPAPSRSRAPSSSSSDGSILGLRRTAFTSSRESLFKRSNSKDDGSNPPTSRKPSEKENTVTNTVTEKIKGLRRTALTSSRESLTKSSQQTDSVVTAANKSKTTRQRSLSASRENLLKKSTSKESLASNYHRMSNTKEHHQLGNNSAKVSSSRSNGLAQRKELDKWKKPSSVPSGREKSDSLALSKSGLQPVDSIKKHKKTLHTVGKPANHKMSDRFRKLVEGDINELATPVASVGKTGGLSERENSFDSGVEFVMHL